MSPCAAASWKKPAPAVLAERRCTGAGSTSGGCWTSKGRQPVRAATTAPGSVDDVGRTGRVRSGRNSRPLETIDSHASFVRPYPDIALPRQICVRH